MQLSELTTIIGGKLIGPDVSIQNIVINGQLATPSDCYIAIIGDKHDGHQFINQAIENGAIACIVSKKTSHAISQIIVENTLDALTRIAKNHKRHFAIPTIALTGSCGKTTVKEMLKSIFPATAFATHGNLNNHIGVPLSILKLNDSHTHAIFELGANHIGEIAHTASLVKPDVCLINNIAPAHLEGFGSIEGVAKAKGEIFAALSPNGTAVVNLDDNRVVKQAEQHQGKKITFSLQNNKADVYASDLQRLEDGCFQWILHYKDDAISISLKVPGKHNISNALAAASAAIALSQTLNDIKHGLESFQGVNKRLHIRLNKQGTRVIDDTYNANIASVKAAIDVLAEFPGRRLFVLGELAEVGHELNSHYQDIGHYALEKKIDSLYSCGEKSSLAQQHFGKGGKHFNDKQQLLQALNLELDNQTTMLVKGSRSAGMEYIIEQLI